MDGDQASAVMQQDAGEIASATGGSFSPSYDTFQPAAPVALSALDSGLAIDGLQRALPLPPSAITARRCSAA